MLYKNKKYLKKISFFNFIILKKIKNYKKSMKINKSMESDKYNFENCKQFNNFNKNN